MIAALAVLAALLAGSATAQTPPNDDPCALEDPSILDDGSALPATAAAIAAGRIVVVALGSSATAGVGVGGVEQAWPAALTEALSAARPKAAVQVVNRGLERQTAADMLARIATDVAPERPHLVVWEVGAFEALRGGDPAELRDRVVLGVGKLRALGADVVLMEPQFSRLGQSISDPTPHIEAIASAARETDAVLFRRYAVMRDWILSGRRSFVTGDRARDRAAALTAHRCWGRLLARQILAAAR